MDPIGGAQLQRSMGVAPLLLFLSLSADLEDAG